VTPLQGTDGEYLRIEIEDLKAHGAVYLYFPTLSWRIWENHPFSVASSIAKKQLTAVDEVNKSESKILEAHQVPTLTNDRQATFITRVRKGTTSALAARVSQAGCSFRLPVLIEGSYRSHHKIQLAACQSILCIVGGVGVSAVLPLLTGSEASSQARLFWGVRKQALVDGLAPEISQLPSNVQADISVGKRLDLGVILRAELVGIGERGLLGIVVCGPPGMADEVRQIVSEIGGSGNSRRAFVLLDEAFSW